MSYRESASVGEIGVGFMKLGYLVFGVSKPDRWTAFCGQMLGLPPALANPDGSLGFRVDDASQRLVVQQHPADDLLALGLDCASPEFLHSQVRKLQASGLRVEELDPLRRAARRVAQLYSVTDPAGNSIELYCGLAAAAEPFYSEAFPAGFRTGDLGMGHAVLVHPALGEMEDFYVKGLGFAVTERLDAKVGPIRVRGTFLHCNARHHSLALFDVPSTKRLHHFMLQANEYMDVGLAFERSKKLKVPLSLDIGQHPDPDGTFSFYGSTPSGFDFEIGAGSRQIDPHHWQAMSTGTTSTWGHQPRLRLKLKTVGSLLLNWLHYTLSTTRPHGRDPA